MKAASFQLHKPSNVEEAIQLLSRYVADDGRIIAGGQSLVPSMMFRMAAPPHLIDINGIDELSNVELLNGMMNIKAGVRHARFERPIDDGPTGRLLSQVVQSVAHHPIRTRGTFCGSLAQSDPSSEWCLVVATLGGAIVAQSVGGRREIAADEYFLGIMQTALQADELLVEIRLPLLSPDSVFGFKEFSRRKGDYAMSMALATWRMVDGLITDARLGIGGAEPFPRRIREAEQLLNGQRPTSALFAAVAEAVAGVIDPLEDDQVDAAYRRDLVRAMSRRAMEQCVK